MIRGLLFNLMKSRAVVDHSLSRRFYNPTNSVFQNNEPIADLFDISEELIQVKKLPQKKSREDSKMTPEMLTKKFMHCFDLSDVAARRIVDQNRPLLKYPLDQISFAIEYLFENNISAKSLSENPWLLGLSYKYIEKKLLLIYKLEPRDINDFVPLIRASTLMLVKAEKVYRKEKSFIPEGNRIYYFSRRLNVEPSLVSKHFSTHMFMFDVDYEMLVDNLNVMLSFEIQPINILKDLWAFKYFPKSITNRLARCREAEKKDLRPWMIRCPEDVLERTLTLSKENKNLLGECTIFEYLSQRLGYNVDLINAIVAKHPAVMKVRAIRSKEILDYLLNEEKFQPYEIANCIRILCHSLKTTKKRINELKEHGCRPSSLVIICKSQTEYQKFLQAWIEKRKHLEMQEESSKS